MRDAFFELAGRLCGDLRADEVLLCGFSGERSDFVRFNKGRVRQAGSVAQRYLSLRLIWRGRQAEASIALAGSTADFAPARDALERMRASLPDLPEDPWLLFSERPQSTSTERRGRLPAAEVVVEQALAAARGLDFVGFYAAGPLYRGFANSLGQRNWHEVDSFNFDWSVYRAGDQAVKSGYAGFDWDPGAFASKVQAAARDLEVFSRETRTLEPGEYRTYLAPRALEDLVGLLAWGGFSARSRATKQTPFLRMESGERLSPRVSLWQDSGAGLAPPFQAEGFVKPERVALIERGAQAGVLVSPRSAKEYGLEPNAAGGEAPDSIDMAGGSLEEGEVLAALGTGLYVSSLWYLNYSDRPAGRITGMTRFATFWVEDGKVASPVGPMRFDDTVFRMLGRSLIDLTRERDFLPSAATYYERSTGSSRLPGALLGALAFTL